MIEVSIGGLAMRNMDSAEAISPGSIGTLLSLETSLVNVEKKPNDAKEKNRDVKSGPRLRRSGSRSGAVPLRVCLSLHMLSTVTSVSVHNVQCCVLETRSPTIAPP